MVKGLPSDRVHACALRESTRVVSGNSSPSINHSAGGTFAGLSEMTHTPNLAISITAPTATEDASPHKTSSTADEGQATRPSAPLAPLSDAEVLAALGLRRLQDIDSHASDSDVAADDGDERLCGSLAGTAEVEDDDDADDDDGWLEVGARPKVERRTASGAGAQGKQSSGKTAAGSWGGAPGGHSSLPRVKEAPRLLYASRELLVVLKPPFWYCSDPRPGSLPLTLPAPPPALAAAAAQQAAEAEDADRPPPQTVDDWLNQRQDKKALLARGRVVVKRPDGSPAHQPLLPPPSPRTSTTLAPGALASPPSGPSHAPLDDALEDALSGVTDGVSLELTDTLLSSGRPESFSAYLAASWGRLLSSSLQWDTSKQRGLCHRLDRDTSGPLLVARSAHAWVHVRRQQKLRAICKEYVCLVHGRPQALEGVVDLPLMRDPQQPTQMVIAPSASSPGALACLTAYRVLATCQVPQSVPVPAGATSQLSLVWVKLVTGRTHQIRLHMARGLGCPLVGDFLYGASRAQLSADQTWCRRLFLHCQRLAFDDPSVRIAALCRRHGLPYEASLASVATAEAAAAANDAQSTTNVMSSPLQLPSGSSARRGSAPTILLPAALGSPSTGPLADPSSSSSAAPTSGRDSAAVPDVRLSLPADLLAALRRCGGMTEAPGLPPWCTGFSSKLDGAPLMPACPLSLEVWGQLCTAAEAVGCYLDSHPDWPSQGVSYGPDGTMSLEVSTNNTNSDDDSDLEEEQSILAAMLPSAVDSNPPPPPTGGPVILLRPGVQQPAPRPPPPPATPAVDRSPVNCASAAGGSAMARLAAAMNGGDKKTTSTRPLARPPLRVGSRTSLARLGAPVRAKTRESNLVWGGGCEPVKRPLWLARERQISQAGDRFGLDPCVIRILRALSWEEASRILEALSRNFAQMRAQSNNGPSSQSSGARLLPDGSVSDFSELAERSADVAWRLLVINRMGARGGAAADGDEDM